MNFPHLKEGESWPQALTSSPAEQAEIDLVIEKMTGEFSEKDIDLTRENMYCLNVEYKSLWGDRKKICDQVDAIISKGMLALRAKRIDNFTEKLFDSLLAKSKTVEFGEKDEPIAFLAIRMIDTMECVLAVKKTYRGHPCISIYSDTYAREQLGIRKLG